jgi:hypothetical protein
VRSSLLLIAAAGFLVQQPPVRDVGPESRQAPRTGTAVVSIVVVNEDGATPQPVRRASVVLTSNELNVNRTELTDDDGKVIFDRVAAGQYLLSASKGGYVRMPYGARRYNQPGAGLIVAEGQRLEGLRISMPHGAVIAGTVIGVNGQPAAGVNVGVMQMGVLDGERRLISATAARLAGATIIASTDERGEFRLYGLPAGRYAVRALGRSGPVDQRSYAEVYYPGTLDLAAAEMIAVKAGEEHAGVTIPLQDMRTARLDGTIRSSGMALQQVQLFLDPDGPFSNNATAGWTGSLRSLG